jgi:hypothetical protein
VDEAQPLLSMELVGAESTWHGPMLSDRFGELHAVQSARLDATLEPWLEEYNSGLNRALYEDLDPQVRGFVDPA